jgi:4'-phosphopantetheinyl transferase superfamily
MATKLTGRDLLPGSPPSSTDAQLPSPAEATIWPLDPEIDDVKATRWFGGLTEDEKARASGLVRREHQRRFVACRYPGDKAELFLRYWAGKEAFLKLWGRRPLRLLRRKLLGMRPLADRGGLTFASRKTGLAFLVGSATLLAVEPGLPVPGPGRCFSFLSLSSCLRWIPCMLVNRLSTLRAE